MEKCLQDFRPGSKKQRISRMNGKAFLLAGIVAGVYGGEVFILQGIFSYMFLKTFFVFLISENRVKNRKTNIKE